MKKYKLKPGKVYKASEDVIFKNLMKDSLNRPFLAKIISLVTKMDYKDLMQRMIISDTNTLEDSKEVKHNEQDMIVTFDNNCINIEMSKQNKDINISKNNTTAHKLAGNIYKTGNRYKTKGQIVFYQICIECYHTIPNKRLITKTAICDLDAERPFPVDETFWIFHINLLNMPNKCYNELSEEERYFKFFLLDDINELERLCKGDCIMERALEILKTLTTDPNIISEFEQDRIMEYAVDVAVNKSEEKGKNEEKREIAKKMLKQNIDIKTIITCTGLTENELKELM